MEHGVKLIHQAFTIFLFCIAVSVLFIIYHSYISALDSAKQINKDKIIVTQFSDIKETTVTKGMIITILLNNPLEYDMEIDGLLISKSENTRENITTYHLNYEKYNKSYAYDSKGKITRIILKGL